MRKFGILAGIVFLLFSLKFVLAQESGKETKRIGGANIVYPKGSQIKQEGHIRVIEDVQGYSGRRLAQLEKRASILESENSARRREIAELKSKLLALQQIVSQLSQKVGASEKK